jgi:hypothetical protein
MEQRSFIRLCCHLEKPASESVTQDSEVSNHRFRIFGVQCPLWWQCGESVSRHWWGEMIYDLMTVVTFKAYHKIYAAVNQTFQHEKYFCLRWMMTRYKIYFQCAVTCKIRPSRIEISFWHVFLFPKDENALQGVKIRRCCSDVTWIACGSGQHCQMGCIQQWEWYWALCINCKGKQFRMGQ